MKIKIRIILDFDDWKDLKYFVQIKKYFKWKNVGKFNDKNNAIDKAKELRKQFNNLPKYF